MTQQKTSFRIGNAEITLTDKGMLFNGFDGRLFTNEEMAQFRAILRAAFQVWDSRPTPLAGQGPGYPSTYGDI